MRLPRDLSGDELIARLRRFGYEARRQSGSHVMLTMPGDPEHHVVVPRQRALKVGLLGGIVTSVANHLGRDRDEFSEELFA